MFVGSVPNEGRKVIAELLTGAPVKKKMFIGCSGNFTIDLIAAEKGYQVYSNDISLYSLAIANILLQKERILRVRNDLFDSLFNLWQQSKFKELIKIMFVLKIAPFCDQKNEYQEYMYNSLIEKNQVFYGRTLAKLKKNNSFNLKIASFFFGDFKEHFKNADGMLFLFAPTYKGGYEKLYRLVDEVFEHEKPRYDLFDSKKAGPYYQELLETKECAIYSDLIYPEIRKKIISVINLNGKRSIYLYSNIGERKHYINYNEKRLYRTLTIIDPDARFAAEDTVEAVACKNEIISHYKYLYMSGRVDYSLGGDIGIVFLVNGRAFGFASFSRMLGTINTYEILFLQSDFAVESNINRLSKLVLFLLISNEVREIIARHYHFNYLGLQTTVYTDKPVSMKYRGAFELERRDKGKLIYIGRFKTKSLNEQYQEWMKLHYIPYEGN